MSVLQRSPSGKANPVQPHVDTKGEFLKPKTQYLALGKKFGSQQLDREIQGAEVNKRHNLDHSQDLSTKHGSLNNKENDRNLINQTRQGIGSTKLEHREIVGGNNSRQNRNWIPQHGISPGVSFKNKGKGFTHPVTNEKSSSSITKQKQAKSPLQDLKRGLVGPQLSSKYLQLNAFASDSNSKGKSQTKGKQGLIFAVESLETQVLNSARDRPSSNDSTKVQHRNGGLQVALGITKQGRAPLASKEGYLCPREQVINLYELSQLKHDSSSNSSIKQKRSASYRSTRGDTLQTIVPVGETSSGCTAIGQSKQAVHSNSPVKADSQQGGTRVDPGPAQVSAFQVVDGDEQADNKPKKPKEGPVDSAGKTQQSRGYLLDSLNKLPVQLDSALKRTRSQLKMDDLREIFEDDPKFIASATKISNLNDFSFSDEKQKSALVERFEVRSPRARKLDFSQIESLTSAANTKPSMNPAHQQFETRKGIGLSNIEKLKNQRRPEGLIDFVSIKNNLRNRRIGMAGLQEDTGNPITKDPLFFGNLTLVHDPSGNPSTPRLVETQFPLKKFKSNMKLSPHQARSQKQLFNKTADGKFIQTDLNLLEREVRDTKVGEVQPDLSNPVMRYHSGGLIKHSWLNQQLSEQSQHDWALRTQGIHNQRSVSPPSKPQLSAPRQPPGKCFSDTLVISPLVETGLQIVRDLKDLLSECLNSNSNMVTHMHAEIVTSLTRLHSSQTQNLQYVSLFHNSRLIFMRGTNNSRLLPSKLREFSSSS